MNDDTTTVGTLRQIVQDFVAERQWHQFHTPKNVSMALAIEAAELMEHFQWISGEASRKIVDQPEKLSAVGQELADVLCYAMAMANELGIDITTALSEKMAHNREKYPADQYRGRYGPEDQRPG